jgi:hypothetical protein
MSKDTVARGLRVTVAVIHLTPVAGCFGPAALNRLYGQKFDDPTTQLLMRHRAVLFGILGSFIAVAATTSFLEM